MKVSKEALASSRTLQSLNSVSLGESTCEEEQVMSDVASLVQASLAHPTSEDDLSAYQSEGQSVTTMLWSSDGILRQALLYPGLLSGGEDEKQAKESLSFVTVKVPSTPLPPMSELQRPGSMTATTISLSPNTVLLTQSLENRTASVPTSTSIESSLLALHSDESFNNSQFPCIITYKSSTSPELLTTHATIDPLPPISEVQKAAGQTTGDEMLSSQEKSKSLSTYQSSSSPGPSDVAGSLLLSSSRGSLPTMSSSQVTSLLNALNSEMSSSETTSKDSLPGLDNSLKLSDQLGINVTSKTLSPRKSISSQAKHSEEIDSIIDNNSSNVEFAKKGDKKITAKRLRVVSAEQSHNDEQGQSTSKVKNESGAGPASKKAKTAETKAKPKATKKKTNNKKVERVSCFKCMFCPYLSLEKAGVDQHIKAEHSQQQSDNVAPSSEGPSQELKCPGCSNVFFSVHSLKVHLGQDHRVSEADIKQMLDCLCPTAATSDSETAEKPPKSKKKVKAKEPSPEVEIYTDEHGKIRLRTGSVSEVVCTPPSSPSQAPDGPDPFDEDSADEHKASKDMKADESVENSSKKRGRPRGSKNIGITALRRQNPNLRLGEKELGYFCGLENCAVRLRSHDNIEYHRRCHASDSSTGVMFSCPECRLDENQWRKLTDHLWKAHVIDMELYACDQCSYKTNSYSKLVNLHKRIHGAERPFLCDKCGKGFKNNKQLRNHKVIHNRNGKNRAGSAGECSICQRPFHDKRLLRIHIDTVHQKLRPFLCNYCGYSASSRSTLKMHMRVHTGEKPFACTDCEYRTADHNSMRRHKMRHSGQKKYNCPHCSYACIQSSTYKTHLRTKHPGLDDGLLFSCPYCPFRTIKRDNHIAHLAEHKNVPNASTSTAPQTAVVSAEKSKAKIVATRQTRSKTVKISNEATDSTSKTTKGKATKNTSPAKVQQKKTATAPAKRKTKLKNTASEQSATGSPNAEKVKKPPTKRATRSKKAAAAAEDSVMITLEEHASAEGSTTEIPYPIELEFTENENNLSSIENLQEAEEGGSEGTNYRILTSQLKLSAHLGDGVPVVTVIDGSKLLQLNSTDYVPITLTADQASTLQLVLSEEPEQITGDISEGGEASHTASDNVDVKFQVSE